VSTPPAAPCAGTRAVALVLAPTPASWVAEAAHRWPELLLDHANCEKKAASTALSLMFSYPEDRPLGLALARLAREELRHFEQVVRVMNELGVPFARQRPGRYAHGLRSVLRTSDPGRKLDLLLMSALIEARSAERFALLAPHLPAPLAQLYTQLGVSEARHHELYIGFAQTADTRGGARASPRSPSARQSWQRRPTPRCAFTPVRRRPTERTQSPDITPAAVAAASAGVFP
jgi:tRNA 2-(methylsulfanyl)-N6-isopentenyladenosine37 hydroxylase